MSKLRLNFLILSFCYLLFSNTGFSQTNVPTPPPSYQKTNLFTIHKYDRQPKPPRYMQNRMEQTHANPKNQWTAKDSLYYAYENVYIQKYELALNIFSKLDIDTVTEPIAQSLYRLTLHKLKRYNKLGEYNQKTIPEDTNSIYSISEAFSEINRVYFQKREENLVIDSLFNIFPLLENQEKLKNANKSYSPAKNDFVLIATAIDSVLRQYSLFNDDKDEILAKAFEEAGDFQKEHLYLTNAFFYYQAAMRYNSSDIDLGNKYNQAIYEMRRKNFLAISMKSHFGKIIKNRFNFSSDYVEEVNINEKEEGYYFHPPVDKKRKDYFPNIDHELLIAICLGIALLFVLLFVKTKKD